MAGPALADTNVPIYGGTTTITTTAKALPTITKAGIIMSGVDNATSKYITKAGEARQQFAFEIVTPSNVMLEDDDVTGAVGSITGGKVVHNGSVQFLNTNNGKVVDVGNFSVNLNKMKVYATELNNDPIDPLAVFNVVPVETPLYPTYDNDTTPTMATISGVKLVMTRSGAEALNGALRTKVFFRGLKFGKAVAVADLVAPTM
jgi:hypothetical protein